MSIITLHSYNICDSLQWDHIKCCIYTSTEWSWSSWVFSINKVNYEMSCATFSLTRSTYFVCNMPHMFVWLTDGSAGIRWRFLKGAVGRSVEDRSVGCQHVATCFLGGSLRWWLGGSLRGLLVLVFLRQTGVGRRASLRNQLGSSRWLIAAVMLWERKISHHQ